MAGKKGCVCGGGGGGGGGEESREEVARSVNECMVSGNRSFSVLTKKAITAADNYCTVSSLVPQPRSSPATYFCNLLQSTSMSLGNGVYLLYIYFFFLAVCRSHRGILIL